MTNLSQGRPVIAAEPISQTSMVTPSGGEAVQPQQQQQQQQKDWSIDRMIIFRSAFNPACLIETGNTKLFISLLQIYITEKNNLSKEENKSVSDCFDLESLFELLAQIPSHSRYASEDGKSLLFCLQRALCREDMANSLGFSILKKFLNVRGVELFER